MALTRIQNRRGTAAEWTAANPTLARGEFGIEYDTGKFKVGTGSATWTSLPYFQDANGIIATITDSAPSTLNTLNEIAEALNDNPDIIDTLATKNNPTFTGTADFTGATVLGIDALPSQSGQTGKYLTTDGVDASWGTIDLSSKQDVVSGVSSTEIGYLDGVTSAIQTQLNNKQAIVAGVSDTEIGYLDGVSAPIQAQLDTALSGLSLKANLENPTFTAIGGSEGGQIMFAKAPTAGNAGDSIIDVYENTVRFGVDGFNAPIRYLKPASAINDSQMRNITLSTSAPSGGQDGDVWLVYTP